MKVTLLVMVIKRLHLLVLRSFLGPFLLTFFIVIFILVMQFLFKYINDLIGKGLELRIIAEFMLYLSTSMVPLALPLALLMAALMTFGNLGEYNELSALKSSGISLQRIMMPLIILTIVLSIGAFFFSNFVLPVANLKMRSLLWDIQRQKPEFQIVEGIFYNGIEGYSIRIGKKNLKTGMLYDLKIYDHSDRQGNTSVTLADSGTMKLSGNEQYLIITLYHGSNYLELSPESRNRRDFSYPSRRDKFQEQSMSIEMTGFGLERTDESLWKSNYNMMSLDQLRHYEDSLFSEIDGIFNGLRATLFNAAYYDYTRNRRLHLLREDSTSAFRIYILNPDSMLHSLQYEEQQQLINQALTQARSLLNYASTTYTSSDSKIRRLRKYQIEIQRKFTLSFACFIFFFIGAPMGAIIRKGGLGMPTVISVLFFLVYYVISLSGEKFARESILPPIQGMWISAVILFSAGIFLTYKATTDAAIMNIDTYLEFFRKMFRTLRFYLIKIRPSG